MIASVLLAVILATTSASDGPHVAGGIERLGAEAFDDRVAAYKAIERLGPSALPALNAAADARDPRVRSRVRVLIDAISRQAEADRFARPTLIRLDFHERPLGEIIDALNEQYDLELSVQLTHSWQQRGLMFDPDQPKRLKALRDRVVTLEAAQPVPYWGVINRLCENAVLHYDAAPRPGFETGQRSLVLMDDRVFRGAVSDSGPFRVEITDLRATFERDFVRNGGAQDGANARDGGDLTVSLAVLAESGLMLHPNGPVSVTEAVDDRARSLILPAAKPPDTTLAAEQNTFIRRASIHVSTNLLAPDPPGTTIRRLRGKVPVVAVTRRADPIIVRLNEVVAEKSIETPDMTLVIDEVSLAPGTRAPVRVTIRPKHFERFAGPRSDRQPPNFAAFDRDHILEQLELRDAAGKKLRLRTGGQARGADNQGFYDRYQLFAMATGEDGPQGRANAANAPIPSELRYYELVQTTTEIPFDFHDIPMP